VIGLDSNVHAATSARGTGAPLITSGFDDFAVLQATFAAAMLETFFKQLKLINTIMTTLPLAWPPADADREHVRDLKAVTFELPTIDFTSASNVMGPEVLPARRKARQNKAAWGKIVS
jgi:hypothetical protein